MPSSRRLAIIGGGRMGEALAAGLVESGMLSSTDIVVAEPDAARREALARLSVETVPDAAGAAGLADTVLLAVKPQVIDDVAAAVAPSLLPGALVVSIAAGISTGRLESLLPEGTAVVRVMPNTPAMVGAGMSAVSGGKAASTAQVETVRGMLSAVGEALVVPEELQNAVTAVSGSGPAYVARFVEALAAGGAAEGLPADVARTLALRTVAGTVRLLEDTGLSPDELVEAVSSPGGTTVAALGVLDDAGFREAILAAVSAAARRAGELGS